MRAAQITRPNGPFEIVERPIPEPGPDWVRIKLQACGVCHSDSLVKEGHWPGLQYPRVPGHEAVGIVDALGAGVTKWKLGQRVGVGRAEIAELEASVRAVNEQVGRFRAGQKTLAVQPY